MYLLPRSLALGLAFGLASCLHGHSAPRINEFMADNESALADADGTFSDWIEIHNPDAAAVSLAGYHLTDNPANPTKWTFPAVTLNAGAYLVVFASNRDRVAVPGQLHTNFELDADGEYLALVAPDGVTVVSGFAPQYPPQFENQSFGLGVPGSSGNISLAPVWSQPGTYSNVIITGVATATETASADSYNLSSGGAFSQYYLWFDFSSRLGQLSAGDVVTSATLQWSGNYPATLSGAPTVDSKLGIFPVPDARHGIDTVATGVTGAEMVNYYNSHTPAAEFNAVKGTTPTVTWNAAALVQGWIDNPAAAQRGQIMILNSARPMFMDWTVDAAAKPTLSLNVTVASDPNAPAAWNFFTASTPGIPNGSGTRAGPILKTVTKNPPQPVSGALTVTAAVIPTNDPITGVKLYYRRMFAADSLLTMTDDGTGGDAVAGDGTWTAVIPAAAIAPGEMTRWRFVATDSKGTETREPAFRAPLDSHEYFGTVGADPALLTNLPVLHWFTTNSGGAGTSTGSRGAVYYNGELYDNVFFNIHGQSTSGFPKKSYNIDFNRTQRFRWSPDAPRVADIDLLTNWADKSKVRHVLAYEVMRESGVAAHFAYTLRVELNGDFFSTADFVEDADNIYLERAGLNPEGALYKIYASNLNPGDSIQSPAVEKKNGNPTDRSDLQALVNGLALTGPALTNYLYDNIDIPGCVSLFAANSVIRNIDMHSKNWYLYRDTGRTNEWAILPWDLDLSQGRVWNTANTYFDNALYFDGYIQTGSSRLGSHLFANPAIRSMIMRRIRTLADRFLQPPPPPGTPEDSLYYERRLNEQSALIDPPAIVPSDAQRDFVKWGSWLQGNGSAVSYTNTNVAVETMAEAITRFKTEYLPQRRDFVYNRQTVGRGGEIPLPQNSSQTITWTPLLVSGAACRAIVPASTALGAGWTGIPALEPYNDAAWLSGTTGVGYERGSGYQTIIGTNVNTQMQTNNSVYVRVEFQVADPNAFEILELRMKYDDGFVAFLNGAVVASTNSPASPQWNSAATGNHEAVITSFDSYDITAHKGNLRAGRNILALQGMNDATTSSDMIVLPELHGGVLGPLILGEPVINFGAIDFSPASGNQDEEFIQLTNPALIAVDISGWRLTGGVEHTFAPGTVLPVGGSLYVSPNAPAFRARAVSPKGGEGRFVQGNFSGHLSSFGETITLRDPAGAVNNSTTYTGNPSDAQRYLVVSEVMYRPQGDGLAEYVELMNISSSVTVSLAGVRFSAGIEFDFGGSAITSLPPGGRVLVVRDAAAFAATHGAGHPVAGVFANLTALSNGGELVKLEDAENGTIREFTYDDIAPWPAEADGTGYSLVLMAPLTGPDHGNPANWRASVAPGGTPGGSDARPYPADPLADANRNGLPDLVDFAFGHDLGLPPVNPAVAWLPYDIGGQTMLLPTITYPVSRGADGVSITVELSTDLSAWPDSAPHLETLSVQDLGDGRSLVTRRVNPPLGTGNRLFVRFLVTGP